MVTTFLILRLFIFTTICLPACLSFHFNHYAVLFFFSFDLYNNKLILFEKKLIRHVVSLVMDSPGITYQDYNKKGCHSQVWQDHIIKIVWRTNNNLSKNKQDESLWNKFCQVGPDILTSGSFYYNIASLPWLYCTAITCWRSCVCPPAGDQACEAWRLSCQ